MDIRLTATSCVVNGQYQADWKKDRDTLKAMILRALEKKEN